MIQIFADKDAVQSRQKPRRIQIFNSPRINVRRLVADPDPRIIFYHAPEEKNLNDIVSKISKKGLVKNDRITAANGNYELYSFSIILGMTGIKILSPIIIEWIRSHRDHRIEVQYGKLKIRASTVRELKAVFELLEKHKIAGVSVKKSGKSKKPFSKGA
jgi:hypothetical protein